MYMYLQDMKFLWAMAVTGTAVAQMATNNDNDNNHMTDKSWLHRGLIGYVCQMSQKMLYGKWDLGISFKKKIMYEILSFQINAAESLKLFCQSWFVQSAPSNIGLSIEGVSRG